MTVLTLPARSATRAVRRSVHLAVVAVLVLLVGTFSVWPAAPAHAVAAPADSSCSTSSAITVDAHEDDDLFFQNPDVLAGVRAAVTGTSCSRTVYATAGDAGEKSSAWYWQSREEGVKAAYAVMAGVANSWTSTTVTVAGKPVAVATLNAAPRVSLVFLRLPDGGMTGQGSAAYGGKSLQKLYQGTTSSLATVDGTATYTLAQLRTTLGALVTAQNSGVVRTLDFAGTFGDGDHSDHHAVAYLVRDAVAARAPAATLIGYRGYSSSALPVNVTGAQFTAKAAAFDAYARADWKLQCSSASACVSGSHANLEGAWLQRQYTVAGSGTTTPVPTPTATPTATATPTVGPSVQVAGSASVSASSENFSTGQV